MAFGTFTLFNFYQQPNTGRFPNRNEYDVGHIVTGGGRDGRVTDQNWEFPYAGRNVPYQVVEGGGALFQVTLFSDSAAEPGAGWTGLHPAYVMATFSGQFEGEVHREYVNTVWSGIFEKHSRDTGYGAFVLSGMVTGSPNDKCYPSFVISGSFGSGELHKATINSTWSGSFSSGELHRAYINPLISGIFTGSKPDKTTWSAVISGKFESPYRDQCSIRMEFSGYSSSGNISWTGVSDEDEITIMYGVDSYSSFR